MSRYLWVVGLTLLLPGCRDPVAPEVVHLLQAAKSTIETAREMGADTYAPEILGLAESEMITGEKEFQTQEGKVFWNRDFSLALRLAHLAQADAEKALSLSEKRQRLSRPTDLPPSSIQNSPAPENPEVNGPGGSSI